MPGHKARIAILGIGLESNRFAPVTVLGDFQDYALLTGSEILESEVIRYWTGRHGQGGFVGRMNQLRPWTPVPVLVADAQAGGPCRHGDYVQIKNAMLDRLHKELPVDGVYVIAHGAGITTDIDDLDGDYLEAVRNCVGPDVPVVATLDLHGNVSDRMCRATDALISHRTNPHVDSLARAEEAAAILDRLLNGQALTHSVIRLPLVTPQVTQLTAAGTPYGDLVDVAQRDMPAHVLSVSILAGFAFSDTAYNGMTIYVLGTDRGAADAYARQLAQIAWAGRHRYRPDLISIEEATEIARTLASRRADGSVIFADVSDNPGGGGSGNTMWLIEAFCRAGVKNVLAGPIHDPRLVSDAEAHLNEESFRAIFNREIANRFSQRFDIDAEVACVKSGDYKSTSGIYKGSVVPLGQSCVLRAGEMQILVVSVKQQLLGPDCFEHFGLDARQASAIIAKSRGHFRAGFAELVSDEDIYEVDAPGLTTPNLVNVEWRNLPRPVYPLDEDAIWPNERAVEERGDNS